jgi:O-acetyl-ADP-ribose deacetylase (regulator of RNase III)
LVNPANENLDHGAGLAKAIELAAGNDLRLDSKKLVQTQGKIEVGKAVVTRAGMLENFGVRKVRHGEWLSKRLGRQISVYVVGLG